METTAHARLLLCHLLLVKKVAVFLTSLMATCFTHYFEFREGVNVLPIN